MNNFKALIFVPAITLALASCSQLLQTVNLDVGNTDLAPQEEFQVIEKTLTLANAKIANQDPYSRNVIRRGRGNTAGPVDESTALQSNFPDARVPESYKIGPGDEVAFTVIKEDRRKPSTSLKNMLTESSKAEYRIGIGDEIAFALVKQNLEFQNFKASFPPAREYQDYIIGVGDEIAYTLVTQNIAHQNFEANFPPSSPSQDYTVGIGDTLTLLRVNDTESSTQDSLTLEQEGAVFTLPNAPKQSGVLATSGRVGSDGSMLLLEVGRIEAAGKTLGTLRSEVRNILIRDGLSPRFQLEISDFGSQTAILTVNSTNAIEQTSSNANSRVITLTDRVVSLRDILANSGIGVKTGGQTLVTLQRQSSTYRMKVRDIFSERGRDVTIRDGDTIFVDELSPQTETGRVNVLGDGTVLIPALGQIVAAGRTAKELRSFIIETKKDLPNIFSTIDLDVVGFGSKQVIVNIDTADEETPQENSKVFTLEKTNSTLRHILSQAGQGVQKNKMSVVSVHRGKSYYKMTMRNIFDTANPVIQLEDGDVITVNTVTPISEIGSTKVLGDGTIVLPELGRVVAANRTIKSLKRELTQKLVAPVGMETSLDLDVVEFDSQSVILTSNAVNISDASEVSLNSKQIVLTNRNFTLRSVLANAGLGIKTDVSRLVTLERASSRYSATMREVYSDTTLDLILEDGDAIFVDDLSAQISSGTAPVMSDGSLIIPEIGKIKAAGKSIDQVRESLQKKIKGTREINKTIEIDVQSFNSQSAIIYLPPGGNEEQNNNGDLIVPIQSRNTSLAEVLIKAGVKINNNAITEITLRRDGRAFVFNFEDLAKSESDQIHIMPNDKIFVEILPYERSKVFALGGVEPKIINIAPQNRDTLADALFTENGVLASDGAQRSDVYLLRGTSPVRAYRLDAQSPTRLIVADAMELRPNDIIYVAEQPIVSFNRVLERILPLRALTSDAANFAN